MLEFWAISKSGAYTAYDMLTCVMVSFDDFLSHLTIPPVLYGPYNMVQETLNIYQPFL